MTEKIQPWRIVPGRGWGPVELGMTYKQAIATLRAADVEVEEDEEDSTYLGIETPWGEFEFDDSSGELARIIILDSMLQLGEQILEEPTLDAAISALGAKSFNDTRWTHGELKHPLPEDADKELLRNGTLWLVSLGLGLEMYRGHVESVILRQPKDVPSSALGPLTPQQLELATNPDIFRDLAPVVAPPSVTFIWLSRLALLICVLLLGLQAYRAYLAETRWSGATPIEGEIIETLPEGVDFPDEYIVSYSPPMGEKQQVTIQSKYMGGMKPVGERVEILYLPHKPEQATTIWEAREHGFVDFIPSMLGIGAGFLAALALLSSYVR
jgi:hypothetical protein